MSVSPRFGIILFDGVCNLCNHAVDFVIRRDGKDRFRFASLQEPFLKDFLKKNKIPPAYLDSIVYIDEGKIFVKSRAVLEISKHLGGGWSLLYGLVIIPAIVRDPIYDWIARNRYRWFGKKSTCRIPTANESAKFLKEIDLLGIEM